MGKITKLLVFLLIISALLSGCAPSYKETQMQIKPGMTYKQIVELLGSEGEICAEQEPNKYRWFLSDYVCAILSFTEPNGAAEKDDLVLYQYEITHGCSFIEEGMTYGEVVKRIGFGKRVVDNFFLDNSGSYLWQIDDHLYLKVYIKTPPASTTGQEPAFPDDYIVYKFTTNSYPH